MGTGVCKLGKGGMEQLVLLPERLFLLIDVGLSDLEGHVLVGDFGDIGYEKDPSKKEDEDADSEIDPLHALQCRYIVLGDISEENVRGQSWSDAGANAVESLGKVDSQFGVLRWSTDYRVQISSTCLCSVGNSTDR